MHVPLNTLEMLNTLQLCVSVLSMGLIYVNISNFLAWMYETRLCNIMVIDGVYFWTLFSDPDSSFKTSPWGAPCWTWVMCESVRRPQFLSAGTSWKVLCPLSWSSVMWVSDLMGVLYNSHICDISHRCKLRSEMLSERACLVGDH